MSIRDKILEFFCLKPKIINITVHEIQDDPETLNEFKYRAFHQFYKTKHIRGLFRCSNCALKEENYCYTYLSIYNTWECKDGKLEDRNFDFIFCLKCNSKEIIDSYLGYWDLDDFMN